MHFTKRNFLLELLTDVIFLRSKTHWLFGCWLSVVEIVASLVPVASWCPPMIFLPRCLLFLFQCDCALFSNLPRLVGVSSFLGLHCTNLQCVCMSLLSVAGHHLMAFTFMLFVVLAAAFKSSYHFCSCWSHRFLSSHLNFTAAFVLSSPKDSLWTPWNYIHIKLVNFLEIVFGRILISFLSSLLSLLPKQQQKLSTLKYVKKSLLLFWGINLEVS